MLDRFGFQSKFVDGEVSIDKIDLEPDTEKNATHLAYSADAQEDYTRMSQWVHDDLR